MRDKSKMRSFRFQLRKNLVGSTSIVSPHVPLYEFHQRAISHYIPICYIQYDEMKRKTIILLRNTINCPILPFFE